MVVSCVCMVLCLVLFLIFCEMLICGFCGR